MRCACFVCFLTVCGCHAPLQACTAQDSPPTADGILPRIWFAATRLFATQPSSPLTRLCCLVRPPLPSSPLLRPRSLPYHCVPQRLDLLAQLLVFHCCAVHGVVAFVLHTRQHKEQENMIGKLCCFVIFLCFRSSAFQMHLART